MTFMPKRLKQYLPGLLRSQHKTFNLLRNFSIISLFTFTTTTVGLALFYWQQATHDLVTLAEENNITVTQLFASQVWDEHNDFLANSQSLSDEELARHPAIQDIHNDLLRQVGGSSIVKIKLFNLYGRTIFATDQSQIGEDQSSYPGFLSAKSGEVVSKLGHREVFTALDDTLYERDLLSSYIPIYCFDSGQGKDREMVGVFELYADVTPLLTQIERTQHSIIFGSAFILVD